MRGSARASVLLVAGCCVLLSACGYKLVRYRGALGDVRRVSIHTLANDSYEPGLDLVMTDALVREFLRRGALDVVEDPALADLVIEGRVLPVQISGRAVSSVLLSLEYQVTVRVALQVKRRDGTEVPVDPTALSETELYLASADVEAASKNRHEALHRVSILLAGRVHDALFERLLP